MRQDSWQYIYLYTKPRLLEWDDIESGCPRMVKKKGVGLLEHRGEVQVHSALGHVSLQGRRLENTPMGREV